MNRWKNMKIPGDIWAPCLTGVLFGITTVLFISLPISRTNENTLGESIFGKNENQKEVNAELLVKVIGENTTGHVQNSKMILNSLGKNVSPEKSCHCTALQEKSTMKKQDNFFFTTF